MVWGGPAPNPFRYADALGCARPTAQLVSTRPRSSGDRASASGAEGRRFESCRGLLSLVHANCVLFMMNYGNALCRPGTVQFHVRGW